MIFQEAKNLKIYDTVFAIGNDNEVYPKQVTGIQLRSGKQIDITYVSQTEKNVSNGYISPHQTVFLKEKDALKKILDGHTSRINDIESKSSAVRDQIKRLERIEHRGIK